MSTPRDLENEKDGSDLEIGRPHGPREAEEEKRSSTVSRDDEDDEHEIRDEDMFEDDLADDGDLDIEPDDAGM